MTLLRFLRRCALVIAVSAVILVAAVSTYLRIEQYRFRRQAEQVLSDLRDLQLKKASAAEVKAVIEKWEFEQWGRGPGQPCTEDECIYRLELVPKPSKGHILAQPFVSALVARPLEWLGLRLTVVHAGVAIRRNALASVSFSVWTTGRGCEVRGGQECTVMAYADTNRLGSGWSSHQSPEVKLKQSLLHPNYLVGSFPELLNADTGGSPAVIIWAEFFSGANSADISRLMQFDVSCLTSFHSCSERDLMPAVWAQSVEDNRRSPKVLTCTLELSKHVAQLADAIAVVRTDSVQLSAPMRGRSLQLRDLDIVNVIKKPGTYAPKLANVYVDKPEMMVTADTKSPIRAGKEYLFLLQTHYTPDHGWMALYPCGALTVNDANLAMARSAAASTE